MPTLTLDVTNEQAVYILDAFNYQTEVPDPNYTGDPPTPLIPNPESPQAFMRRQLIQFLKQRVKQRYLEVQRASSAANWEAFIEGEMVIP